METCERARRLFYQYLDEHLEPAEMRMVEKHLEECLPCREEAKRLQRLDEACRGLPLSTMNARERAACWGAIRERIGHRETLHYEPLRVFQRLREMIAVRKPALLMAVSACLLAIVVVSALFFIHRKGNEVFAGDDVLVDYIQVESPDYIACCVRDKDLRTTSVYLLKANEPKGS